MESVGEEKKLQALFSELKAADEQTAPHFATVRNRAQSRPRRIRGFNPAFVAATALIVFALISLAVWSRYSQRTQPQPIQAVAPALPKIDSAATVTKPSPAPKVVETSKPRNVDRELVAKRFITQRHAQQLAANRKLTQDAKTIASWKSPTTALLSSPSDEIFSSLPQLNKSSSDLKSFLPTRSN